MVAVELCSQEVMMVTVTSIMPIDNGGDGVVDSGVGVQLVL